MRWAVRWQLQALPAVQQGTQTSSFGVETREPKGEKKTPKRHKSAPRKVPLFSVCVLCVCVFASSCWAVGEMDGYGRVNGVDEWTDMGRVCTKWWERGFLGGQKNKEKQIGAKHQFLEWSRLLILTKKAGIALQKVSTFQRDDSLALKSHFPQKEGRGGIKQRHAMRVSFFFFFPCLQNNKLHPPLPCLGLVWFGLVKHVSAYSVHWATNRACPPCHPPQSQYHPPILCR